ncbi:fimbrial protein [Vibrio sp.]|uniref:fimbrial protein n=1 Tax=Vibrio sp. TaxID=678 RepID=UPI003AA8F8B8
MTRYILWIFALILTLGINTQTWALACYSTDAGGSFGGSGPGGVSHFYIDPSASVPESAPNDQVIWRGTTQTVTITCYKDATHYPRERKMVEQVYFWPGKTGDTGVPDISGIKVGFRYNGIDIYGSKTPVESFIVDKCATGETNSACEVRTKVTKTITYQPIIVTGPGTFEGYSSPLNIFQVDGVKGYNGKYSNYNAVIENMDVLKPSKCEVELKLQNNNVDFGLLNENDIRNTVTQPVSIVVTNIKYGPDCRAVQLRGYFNNIRDANNNIYIPAFDPSGNKLEGLAIKLHTENGTPVKLNEPIDPGYEIEKVGYDRYNATLYALDSDNIDKGKFEAMVIYSVSYL